MVDKDTHRIAWSGAEEVLSWEEVKRHFDEDIQTCRDELARAERDIAASAGSELRKGQLACREAEIVMLKKTLAECVQEKLDFVATLKNVPVQPRAVQLASRIAGYEEMPLELGVRCASSARKDPKTLRFHVMGDGSLEAIAAITCNKNTDAKTYYVGACFAKHRHCSQFCSCGGAQRTI